MIWINCFGFLKEQEFNRLISRISSQHGDLSVASQNTDHQPDQPSAPDIKEAEYELITTPEQLNNWVTRIEETGIMAVDTETTSLNASEAQLVGISIAIAPGVAAYIPIRHRGVIADHQGQLGFDLGADTDTNSEHGNSKDMETGLLPDQMAIDDVMFD